MSAAGPMGWGRRYVAYSGQRGSWRLTARQLRRYVRKAARVGDSQLALAHLERIATYPTST